MRTRLSTLLLAAGSALALGGCAYGGLGGGLGYGDYGYSPYGYSSYGYGSPYYGGYGYPRSGVTIGVGYGSGYGGYGYGSPYYGGFGMPSYGWYNNYYYPGSGYYVYDSYRRPYAMTTTQRNYWAKRSPALTTRTTTTTVKPNWSAFNRSTKADRQTARSERRAATVSERRANRRNND